LKSGGESRLLFYEVKTLPDEIFNRSGNRQVTKQFILLTKYKKRSCTRKGKEDAWYPAGMIAIRAEVLEWTDNSRCLRIFILHKNNTQQAGYAGISQAGQTKYSFWYFYRVIGLKLL